MVRCILCKADATLICTTCFFDFCDDHIDHKHTQEEKYLCCEEHG